LEIVVGLSYTTHANIYIGLHSGEVIKCRERERERETERESAII